MWRIGELQLDLNPLLSSSPSAHFGKMGKPASKRTCGPIVGSVSERLEQARILRSYSCGKD